MIHTLPFKDTTWLDIEHPTKEDIEHVVTTYGIDRVTAHELITPSASSHIEPYEKYLYIVLHFPSFKRGRAENATQEIDFVLNDKALITTHYAHIDALHHVGKQLETDSIIEKGDITNTSSYLFFRIIRELYQVLFNEIASIDRWTSEIEQNMFKGKERDMVVAISHLSRALIDIERTLAQHKDVLDVLKKNGGDTFGKYFAYHVDAVIEEYAKLTSMIKSRRDIVSELRDTDNSLLSSKQNEASRVIAVLALIAVPMSLIVSIFQIDTKSRPLVGSEYDFWVLVGGVLAIGLILFLFFKYKKWL